ncbi:hypothetical protein ACFVT9_11280 [Kitasatospora cineracea]|uniref:hypothetical protein n=1 Tax=Kitasatospora cineracea TaxID=88074 RepID=UPI0036948825
MFSSLTGGGTYTVPLGEERHVRGGSYEYGTPIRYGRWMTSGGAVERREAVTGRATAQLYGRRGADVVLLARGSTGRPEAAARSCCRARAGAPDAGGSTVRSAGVRRRR